MAVENPAAHIEQGRLNPRFIAASVAAGALGIATLFGATEAIVTSRKDSREAIDSAAKTAVAAARHTHKDTLELLDLEDVADNGAFYTTARSIEGTHTNPAYYASPRSLKEAPIAGAFVIPRFTPPALRRQIMRDGRPLSAAEARDYAREDHTTPDHERHTMVAPRASVTAIGTVTVNRPQFDQYLKLTNDITRAARESILKQKDLVDSDSAESSTAYTAFEATLEHDNQLLVPNDDATRRKSQQVAQTLSDLDSYR